MEKTSPKMAYFKLRSGSGSFYNSKSGLHLINKTPGCIPIGKVNKEVLARLKGHIVKIDKDEYDELMLAAEEHQEASESVSDVVRLAEMTKEELSDFAADNLEGDNLDAYNALKNQKARVKYLTDYLEA